MQKVSHPFNYNLNITYLPSKNPDAHVMVCLHGYGGSGRIIQKLRANRLITDHLVGFDFPDANIIENQYDPKKTTFGTIQELLPAIYVIKRTINHYNLDIINVYGFSAGGGALINLIAVLNGTRYDTELASIGIKQDDKRLILSIMQRGYVILDCPLKSVDEILESQKHKSYPLQVIANRYALNNLKPIDSLPSWHDLKLNVILYFATPDQIIFNRDDELFVQRLKQVNQAGKTIIIQTDEGGHNANHKSLWRLFADVEWLRYNVEKLT